MWSTMSLPFYFVLGIAGIFFNNIQICFGVVIDGNHTIPGLAAYDQCPIKFSNKTDSLPTFAMCDPDGLFNQTSNEIKLQTEYIRNCKGMRALSNTTEEISKLTTVLVFVRDITVLGGRNSENDMHMLRDQVIQNFNISSVPSYLIIIKAADDFQVLEWFSDPLQKIAARLPDHDKNRTPLYNQKKTNLIIVAFHVICDTIQHMLKPPIRLLAGAYKIMGIVFALIMSVGLITACCWCWRFYKNHEDDESTEETETEMIF